MLKVILGIVLLLLLMVALCFAAAWYLRWARNRDLRVDMPPARRQPDRFTFPDADAVPHTMDESLSVWEHNAR